MNKLQQALNKFTGHKCNEEDFDLAWLYFNEARLLQGLVDKQAEAEVETGALGVSEYCPVCKALLHPGYNAHYCGACGKAITRKKGAPRSQKASEGVLNNGSQPL